jgi:plastocyanin
VIGMCALMASGCGGEAGSSDAATVVEAGEDAIVEVLDNTFRPEAISVASNTEVVWTNKGRNDHDIAPVDGEDWGIAADRFGPDAAYSYRFTEPGRYTYYCTLHGTKTRGMIGAVVVRE